MHKPTDELDKLATECFDSFLRGIVDILCNESGGCDIEDRIEAAKEFSRQLTSQSTTFAPLQFRKWNNLNSRTKDYVKNEVSIENGVLVAFVVAFIHTIFITICYS